MSNFRQSNWLDSAWVTLVMQCWNKNIYPSIMPKLAMLRWCQHHNYCEPGFIVIISLVVAITVNTIFSSFILFLHLFIHYLILFSSLRVDSLEAGG